MTYFVFLCYCWGWTFNEIFSWRFWFPRELSLHVVVQSLVVSDSLRSMGCSTPGFPVLHYFLELAQTHVHPVGDAIQPSHPLLSPFLLLLSVISSIRVFSNDSVLCISWPRYWSFNFSISPSNEYSGVISSRMDWLDLLAVQGTLTSLLQHHSSKASILQHSACFVLQLSRLWLLEKP